MHCHSVGRGRPDSNSPPFLSLVPPVSLKPNSAPAPAVSSARACARFSDACSKAVEHSGDKSRNGTFRIKRGGEGTAFYRQSENKVYERLGRKSRDRAAV